MKKKYSIILLFLFALYINFCNAQCKYIVSAECNANIFHDTAIVCSGSALVLSVEQSNCPKLIADFNSGILDTTIFEANNTIIFSPPCNPTVLPASGKVVWMGGTTLNRELRTKTLNLSNSTFIEWDMKYGDNPLSPDCEPPDGPSEGVYFEYSIDNGANWLLLSPYSNNSWGIYGNSNYVNGSGGYWMPVTGNNATGSYYTWNHYLTNIPAAAKTSHTKIRWCQKNYSSNTTDNWGLDNIAFSICPDVTVNWSNGLHTKYPPPCYPLADTSIEVTIIDSSLNPIHIFKDTIWIKMSNSVYNSAFTVTPSVVCSITDTALITYTGNAPLNSQFKWDFGFEGYILSGGNGSGPFKVLWNNYMLDSIMGNISLTINPNTLCRSSQTTQIVKIYRSPYISFSTNITPTLGCSPLTLNFDNQTTPINNLFTTWYFGDGDTSLLYSPSHTYQNAGTYNITIECTTDKGCKSSFTADSLIHVIGKPPTPTIYKNADTLYTDYQINMIYHWYFYDSEVSSTNQYFYIPDQIGYYSVATENSIGCFSLPSIYVLSIDQSEIMAKDILLNNPTTDFFGIRINPIVSKVEILDYRGILLKSFPERKYDNMYLVDDLATGLYIVRIYADGLVNNLKLIKY